MRIRFRMKAYFLNKGKDMATNEDMGCILDGEDTTEAMLDSNTIIECSKEWELPEPPEWILTIV